jgi:hypothetical protein
MASQLKFRFKHKPENFNVENFIIINETYSE